MDLRLDSSALEPCGQLLHEGRRLLLLCEHGETFDYQPVRRYYAVPPDLPTRPEYALYEKEVPADADAREVAWNRTDWTP